MPARAPILGNAPRSALVGRVLASKVLDGAARHAREAPGALRLCEKPRPPALSARPSSKHWRAAAALRQSVAAATVVPKMIVQWSQRR